MTIDEAEQTVHMIVKPYPVEVTKQNPDQEYHIKGNISIATWDKHKDLIKVFWDGADILKQGSVTDNGVDHWYTVTKTEDFNEHTNYLCVMSNFKKGK